MTLFLIIVGAILFAFFIRAAFSEFVDWLDSPPKDTGYRTPEQIAWKREHDAMDARGEAFVAKCLAEREPLIMTPAQQEKYNRLVALYEERSYQFNGDPRIRAENDIRREIQEAKEKP